MRDGTGYWRMMADLNPAIPNGSATEMFRNALRKAAPDAYTDAEHQGDKYFYIPALDRHRGATHFYLEGYRTESPMADLNLASSVGVAAIDTYLAIATQAVGAQTGEADKEKQLAYHTLYFYQVLSLDRGTTSGLLVHNQNDTGILGSLPANIDRGLLESWIASTPSPQDLLLKELLQVLPAKNPTSLDDTCKGKLANVVRAHYQRFPEALAMQASGNVLPPTVANHKS